LFLVARVIAVRICNCALLICCLFGQVSLEKEVLNLNSATMLVVAGHFSVIFLSYVGYSSHSLVVLG